MFGFFRPVFGLIMSNIYLECISPLWDIDICPKIEELAQNIDTLLAQH